jgi:hypothetical protein
MLIQGAGLPHSFVYLVSSYNSHSKFPNFIAAVFVITIASGCYSTEISVTDIALKIRIGSPTCSKSVALVTRHLISHGANLSALVATWNSFFKPEAHTETGAYQRLQNDPIIENMMGPFYCLEVA